MIKSDDNNLMLVESIASVDKLNAEFYGLSLIPGELSNSTTSRTHTSRPCCSIKM